MQNFLQFMATYKGRIIRVVFGLVLFAIGLTLGNWWGYGLALFGVLPFTAGAFDLCYLAPFFGMPVTGEGVRSCKPKL